MSGMDDSPIVSPFRNHQRREFVSKDHHDTEVAAANARIAALEAALRTVAIGEDLDKDEASPERYCWCPFGWQGDHVPYCLQARAALAGEGQE